MQSRSPEWNAAIEDTGQPGKNGLLRRLAGGLFAGAVLASSMMVSSSLVPVSEAQAQDAAKPNILVIFGDDVGQSNVSAYTHGLVGYQTPNIDRIAKEGMMFTDCYAENSCTAGRSTFITGQTPWRTGLSKVGVPGAPVGAARSASTRWRAPRPGSRGAITSAPMT